MRTTTRALIAVLCLARVATAASTGGEGPRAVVDRITKAALGVLGDKQLSADDKRHRIEAIVYADTDFETMSRLVLARNWNGFTDAQKADFVKQFKEHLSMTYGRSIENYRNERVQIVGDHEEARGDWTVQTKIVRGGGSDDIMVDYRLRNENGRWWLIDIIIERVSLVANFRSQFQDILSSGGPEKLLDLLRDKNTRGEPLKAPGAS